MNLLDDLKDVVIPEDKKTTSSRNKGSQSGNNIYLDKSTTIYHRGEAIGTLGDIQPGLRCDCLDGSNHSDGQGFDYAHTVQLGGGEVGIKCSGDQCSGITYLPNKELTQEDKREYMRRNDTSSMPIEDAAESNNAAYPGGEVMAAGGTTPLLQIKKFSELNTKRIEAITLCGVPFPKEGLGMIAGNGGVGKSSVVIKLTISYLSMYPNERALLWFTEDHEAIIRERFEKQEVPEDISNRIDFIGTQIRNVMDFLPAVMIELAGLCQGHGITVLDPLISFYSGEENDNKQARQFINQMTALSGLVLLIHHSSKSGETSRGASDFRNGVRIAYRVDKPEIIYQVGKHNRKGDDIDLLGARALILDKDNWDIAGQATKTIRAHDNSGFMIPVFQPTEKHQETAALIRKSIKDELSPFLTQNGTILEVHTLIDMRDIIDSAKKPDPTKRGDKTIGRKKPVISEEQK